MSDLISRSELLKEIEKYKFGAISNDTEREYIKNTILNFINFQPTAYSVEKVVEELEKRKALHERLVDYETKNGTVTEKYQHVKAIDVLNEAIEIVKQSGVSDDVREKDKNGGGMMERLTKRIFVPKGERELVVFTQGKYIDTIPAEMTHEDIRKVLRKLAQYEDLEEQGLLLRLPCSMSKSADYNKLFFELQKDCNNNNCCNAFADITLGELIKLNHLLDRLLIFCENIDSEELEDYECGDKVYELYKLADTLFSRDLS